MNRRFGARALAAAGVVPAAAAAAPPDGLAFDPVSLHVADFDRARALREERLGFRPERVWRAGALGGARLAYLARDDARLELLDAGRHGVRQPAVADIQDHDAVRRYGHACSRVGDVDSAPAGLAADGVPAWIEVGTYDLKGTPHRRRVGFARGPEGHVIGFAEPLPRT